MMSTHLLQETVEEIGHSFFIVCVCCANVLITDNFHILQIIAQALFTCGTNPQKGFRAVDHFSIDIKGCCNDFEMVSCPLIQTRYFPCNQTIRSLLRFDFYGINSRFVDGVF